MVEIKRSELYKLQEPGGEHNLSCLPPGFSWQDTPGHGYLITSQDIINSIPVGHQSTKYSRGGRYEEDCDWAIPVCFNLHLFDHKTQARAIDVLYDWHPRTFAKRFGKLAAQGYKYQEAVREKTNKNLFLPATAWGSWDNRVPEGYIGVRAKRRSDEKEIHVLVPENEYEPRTMPGFTEETYMPWYRPVD